MVDPKMVELSMYASLPHLGHDVVTSNRRAASALNWAVKEMERRYRLLHANHARNVIDFNRKVEQKRPLKGPRETLVSQAGPQKEIPFDAEYRSEEHTSELQSQSNLVCRLLLEKKKDYKPTPPPSRFATDSCQMRCRAVATS